MTIVYDDEPIRIELPSFDDAVDDEDVPFYLGDLLFYYLVDISGGLPRWIVKFINLIDRGLGLLIVYCIFSTVFMFLVNLFPQ